MDDSDQITDAHVCQSTTHLGHLTLATLLQPRKLTRQRPKACLHIGQCAQLLVLGIHYILAQTDTELLSKCLKTIL